MEPSSNFKILEGWLHKKGNFINKSYKKRWCVLYEQNKLSYFENDKSLKENGEINICDVYKITEPQPSTDDTFNENYKSEFVLHTRSRIWEFKCDNSIELTKWLKYLKRSAFPKVIHCGYLYKKDYAKWNKYYFELNVSKQLRYYTDKNKQKFISVIYIPNIKNFTFFHEHYNRRSNVLQLMMTDSSVVALSALSKEDQFEWHKYLSQEHEFCQEEKKILERQCKLKYEEAKQKDINENKQDIDIVLGVKIHKSHFKHMNTICQENESNGTICSCVPILRICSILNIYHKWFNVKNKSNIREFSGMLSFINNFLSKYESRLHCAYSTSALLNDFHHIIDKHELNYVLTYIKYINGIGCVIDKCQMIRRHYRDKSKYRNKEKRNVLYFGYGGNTKEVNIQNIFDNIHCYIFHSYDTLQLSPYDINQIQSELNSDDEKDINDKNSLNSDVIDLNTIALMHTKSILSRKKTELTRILNVVGFKLQSSKYRTDINGQKRYDKEINEKYPNVTHISARLYYHKKYLSSECKEFYVEPKYDNLRNEIQNNEIYTISKLQWVDIILRATDLIECNKGKKLISYIGWKNNKSQSNYERYYNIAASKQVNKSHILAVLLYCNYSEIHYRFIRTLTGNNWKNKHCNFAHLGRLLREIVEVYGNEIDFSDNVSYYHLIKTEYLFKSNICKFNGILSTTNDLSVGIIYSINAPLILDLNKYGDIGCYKLNCNWISDFTNEFEFISAGSYCMEIVNIIHIKLSQDYNIYINAMTIIYRFINGEKPKSGLISIDYQKAINKLFQMETSKQSNKEIPAYIECLFHFQCLSIKYINIDANMLFNTENDNNCNYVSIRNVFINDNCDWVYIDLFINVFPNIEQIKINCKGKIEMNLNTFNKLIGVLQSLALLPNEKIKLKCIEFIEPSETSLSFEKINKEFKEKLLQSAWKIEWKSNINRVAIQRIV